MSNILVVDDDVATAMLEKRSLERAGHHVSVVTSASDAFDVLEFNVIQLMILDYSLPGMTGLEFHESIKRQGFQVPILMVTGWPDDEVAMRAKKAGIEGFLLKSEDFLQQLPTAASQVLNDTALAN
jgi:two-component system, cell cycle sensor histidine kinase and response regulator CckA